MGISQTVSAIPGLLASRVEPAAASPSRQAPVKTLLNPSAVLHAPQDTQQQAGPYSGANMFRVPCVCGYLGCWYSLESFAMDAHLRHAARNLGGAR